MQAITAPLILQSTGAADISISDVRLDYVSTPMSKCGDEG
jgi:beta-glucosidase